MVPQTHLNFCSDRRSDRPSRRKNDRGRFLRLGLLAVAVAAVFPEFFMDLVLGDETTLSEESCVSNDANSTKVWKKTQQTLSEFYVAGVNLALYKQQPEEETTGRTTRECTAASSQEEAAAEAESFELYENFNIADQITGNEDWLELTLYRKALERPSLSFYVDKVARKRWLPAQGFEQPELFLLKYASELTESGQLEDEKTAVLKSLPTEKDYAAKPTHKSLTDGVWLVNYDVANGITRFSNTARELIEEQNFNPEPVAESLAFNLHEKADNEVESWALQNVKPGLVIEERFVAFDSDDAPPLEFNIFTIWGRVWVAQMNYVEGQNRWCAGFLHRNGTALRDSADGTYMEDIGNYKMIADWLDWAHLINIAERLGAHKDMFRTDIFVGVPAGSPSLREGATKEERRAMLKYVVSESEIFPTTIFVDKEISDEGARLWIAGYKMGNYRLVPNTEVPKEFLENGSLSIAFSSY